MAESVNYEQSAAETQAQDTAVQVESVDTSQAEARGDAVGSVQGSSADAKEEIVNAGVDIVMDVFESVANDENYGNPVSSVIAGVGNIAGSLLPGKLGELANKLFKALADKIDKTVNPTEDMRTQEHNLLNRSDITDVTREVADTVGMDSVMFAENLSQAADILDGKVVPEEGMVNEVMDIGAAIKGSAQAYPVVTASSLQAYSDMNESWLREHGEEYPEAEDDIVRINQAMAESYYEAVMEAEASGLALSDADREAIENFHMYGVDMTYEDFVKEHQEILENQQGNEYVVRSDGSLESGIGVDMEAVRKTAADEVYNGAMADHREDIEATDYWAKNTGEAVDKIREAGPENMGDAYMARVAAMQAYNDAAVSAIAEKYVDDPEGRRLAEEGLAMRMQAGMGPLFDAMKEDQAAHGCFSQEQLEKLGELKLTGVTVSYDEYVQGTGLFPVTPEAGEDDQLYANAISEAEMNGSSTPSSVGAGQYVPASGPEQEPVVPTASKAHGKSYGERAEEALHGSEISGKTQRTEEYSVTR